MFLKKITATPFPTSSFSANGTSFPAVSISKPSGPAFPTSDLPVVTTSRKAGMVPPNLAHPYLGRILYVFIAPTPWPQTWKEGTCFLLIYADKPSRVLPQPNPHTRFWFSTRVRPLTEPGFQALHLCRPPPSFSYLNPTDSPQPLLGSQTPRMWSPCSSHSARHFKVLRCLCASLAAWSSEAQKMLSEETACDRTRAGFTSSAFKPLLSQNPPKLWYFPILALQR